MTHEIYKRPYRIRRATVSGKEVTVPPGTKLQAGDEVTVYYDGFVLVVPRGMTVDEELLRQSMGKGSEKENGATNENLSNL